MLQEEVDTLRRENETVAAMAAERHHLAVKSVEALAKAEAEVKAFRSEKVGYVEAGRHPARTSLSAPPPRPPQTTTTPFSAGASAGTRACSLAACGLYCAP